MRITVKECLNLKFFKNAKVAASERDLSNIVKGVSVLEGVSSAEAARFSSCKEKMVMTGFFHLRNNPKEQCETIKNLAANGCAALVIFHVGFVVPEISRTVVDTADLYRLPVIIFEGERPTSAEVSTELMKELLYGENFNNSLINNTIYHLLNFEKYSNFNAAMKAASINNDFQMVLVSADFNPVFSVETLHRLSIEDAVTARRNLEISDKNRLGDTLMDVKGVITYWGPVTIKEDKYYLLIVDNNDRYSASEITKLAEIIELAMGMWKYTPERDAKAEFIKALRRGNKSLAYTLKNEAGVKGSEIVGVFYTRILEDQSTIDLFAELEKRDGIKVIKGIEGDEAYGIILYNCEGEEESADKLSTARMYCNEKFNVLKGGDDIMLIFHVTGLDGIEGAADAFRLIVETWMFVQTVFPHKHVFSKFEMVLVSNCINIQLQSNYVKRNYLELLEPFKELGENKGKQLLETLETFVLDAGMNSSRTSEIMGIHTNTVQYRLKKINDVLGVEITGNRIVPGLTISLALKRLERIVR